MPHETDKPLTPTPALGESKPEVKPAHAPEKLPPEEWAKRKGQIQSQNVPVNDVLGTGPHFTWQHAAADALHGWSAHAFQEGKPLLLTEAEYQGALDAASAPQGNPEPHMPAHSKHGPKPTPKPEPEQPSTTVK